MVEYILGIGHLTREDCQQVMSDVTRRLERLSVAKQALDGALKNELDHLTTIKFQVAQREKEIWEENEKKNG